MTVSGQFSWPPAGRTRGRLRAGSRGRCQTIQPLEPVPGIRTVGELEVADLVRDGAQLVDTRVPDSRSGTTLHGAVNIPHDQVIARKAELDTGRVHILFCNGPQCPQTPDALRTLSEDGYPLDRLAYYRGGMHDWVTLAMPTQAV